uniref:Uncharacterized protein n=1 Tax=Octopus bimaculoides TaxID=37653 RepID=A0A0L8HZ30_OCTBM
MWGLSVGKNGDNRGRRKAAAVMKMTAAKEAEEASRWLWPSRLLCTWRGR